MYHNVIYHDTDITSSSPNAKTFHTTRCYVQYTMTYRLAKEYRINKHKHHDIHDIFNYCLQRNINIEKQKKFKSKFNIKLAASKFHSICDN